MIERIQFRPGPITSDLERRGAMNNAEAGQIAQRDLERYYTALVLALASVDLTEAEASFLVDALNGSIIELHGTVQGLAYEVADALPEIGEKWEVGRELQVKVEGWTLLQRLAVCDAVERFWSGPYRKENMRESLAQVGLIRRG